MFTRTWFALVALAVSLAPRVALAQPAPAGCANLDQEISAGVDLRERNLDQAALDLFLALSRRCPSPRVTAQIGLAEASLERWFDAHTHLTEALGAAQDPWISARHAAVEDVLRDVHTHLVEVGPAVAPEGAVVVLDGRRVASLPQWVMPGEHSVLVTAPGHRMWRRTMAWRAGERFTTAITLESDAPPPPSTPPPRVDERAPPSRVMRNVGIVLIATGVAAGAVGVVQWVRTSGQNADAANAMWFSPGDLGAWARYTAEVSPASGLRIAEVCSRASTDASGNPDAAGANNLCASNSATRAMALGFGIGGAVLTGVGVALVVLSPSARRTALRVTPWLGARAQGVQVGLSF